MQQPHGVPGSSSSLGSRRPYAANLPALTGLPAPPMAQLHDKYQPFTSGSGMSQPQASTASVASAGSLLTPPNTLPGETNMGTASGPSASNTMPMLPPFPTQQLGSYWQNGLPAIPQYGPYHSGTSPGSQWIPPRGMYSPSSLDSIMSSSRSMSMGGQMQPSSYELNQLAPFSANMSMSGSVTLPAMSATQQPQSLNVAYVNGQMPMSGASSQQPQSYTHESYISSRLVTHPNQSGQSPNTHSPATFQFPPNSASMQRNPTSPTDTSQYSTSSNPLSRTTSAGETPISQSPNQYQRIPSFGYSNHNPSGSVLSNLHRPGARPSLVNNMQSSSISNFSGGSMQSMYGRTNSPPDRTHTTQPQHQTPSDRPFKCDVCPQSFNRNHDLKRHKRIHLAVKPYPCGYCDKSFSRKDALKRHILVKGCGKSDPEGTSGSNPPSSAKMESESPSDSPVPHKTESEDSQSQ